MSADAEAEPRRVDPRAPRFGQAITATLLAVGVVLSEPLLVYLVAGILVLAVVSQWRIDLYALLWRHGASRLVERPTDMEAAAPHRFAKLLGATGTTVAAGLLAAGAPVAGFAIAGIVAVLAGLAATTGLCLGCKMYRQVSFLRRHELV